MEAVAMHATMCIVTAGASMLAPPRRPLAARPFATWRIGSAIALLVALALGDVANAAGGGASTVEQATPFANFTGRLDEIETDRQVPTSPAVTALGVTPSREIRSPGNSAVAAQLFTGVDPRGVYQTAVALEMTPYLLFAREDRSLADYQRWAARVMRRFSISGAASRSSSDGESAIRLAITTAFTLWDGGDPYRDAKLEKCLWGQEDAKLADIDYDIEELTTTYKVPESLIRLAEEYRTQYMTGRDSRCVERAAARSWNAPHLSVGTSPSWIGTDGETDSLEWNTANVWVSAALNLDWWEPLEDWLQIVGTATFINDEKILNPRDPTDPVLEIEQDSDIVSLSIRAPLLPLAREKPPDLILAFSTDYLHMDRGGGRDEDAWRLALSAEYRIARHFFFSVAAGTTTGGFKRDSQGFISAMLRFGF